MARRLSAASPVRLDLLALMDRLPASVIPVLHPEVPERRCPALAPAAR
jgi:hypothetical protein